MNRAIIEKELMQGVVPIGTPKAYQYDQALVESAVATVQQGLTDITVKAEAEKEELNSYTETQKTEISTLGQGYVDEANIILNAIRTEYGYPFVASTVADMTDPTKIYVYVGSETGYVNGDWYYYDGTEWVSGGTYNAVVVQTDTTLTQSGVPADAKATGDAIDLTEDKIDVLEDEMEHLYTPSSSATFDYSSNVITGAFVRAAYMDIREFSGFFYTNLIPLHKGEKFTISAYASGTSVAWLSKWTSENVCESVIQTSVKNTETTFDYTATEDVEYLRFSNNETAGSYHFDVVKTTADGYASELTQYIKDISGREEISVGVGKDFASIVDAISSLDTTKKYTIYVYPGTYDTVVTANIDENYKGLIIPNNVDIIGMGNRDDIIIRGQLTNSTYATYANNISTINLTMNNHVENVTIESKNIRYCNHDDGTDATIPGSMISAKHTFKNVKFVVDAFDDGFSGAGFCVGIGGQADKEVHFEECEFVVLASGTRIGILAHDNTANTQLRGMRLYVKNCTFTIPSGYSVRLQSGGGSMDSYCYLIGNKLNNKALRYTAGTGVLTNVWKSFVRCNEGYTLNNGTSFDLTDDVIAFGNFTIE